LSEVELLAMSLLRHSFAEISLFSDLILFKLEVNTAVWCVNH